MREIGEDPARRCGKDMAATMTRRRYGFVRHPTTDVEPGLGHGREQAEPQHGAPADGSLRSAIVHPARFPFPARMRMQLEWTLAITANIKQEVTEEDSPTSRRRPTEFSLRASPVKGIRTSFGTGKKSSVREQEERKKRRESTRVCELEINIDLCREKHTKA